MQAHALPGERQDGLAPLVGHPEGVQGRVEHHRMNPEAAHHNTGVLRGLDLGEDLGAPPPRRAQAPKRRAVPVAPPGQILVGAGHIDRVTPTGGHTDRSASGAGEPSPSTPRACSVHCEPACEYTAAARDPPSPRRPTTTWTRTAPAAGRGSGADSVSSSITGQPTSSPARSISSTNPAPGNSTVPVTA